MAQNPAEPHTEVNAFRGVLSKSVAGGANVTLTDVEAAKAVYVLTGALTADIDLIVPTEENTFYAINDTTGSYTLTVKTSAGTGIAVTQGKRRKLYCDGTDVDYLNAEA